MYRKGTWQVFSLNSNTESNERRAQLDWLTRELDARIGNLRAKFGEIGDTRLTVMAAITVAEFQEIVRQSRQFSSRELLILAHQDVIDLLLSEESATLAELTATTIAVSCSATDTVTDPPVGVYLVALSTRLVNACLSSP